MTTVTKFVAENPDKRFDMIHVDGAHDHDHVMSDMENTRKLCKEDTIVILDDDNAPPIRKINQEYVDKGLFTPLPGYLPTTLYTHLIGKFAV